jgi:hypothetical protein
VVNAVNVGTSQFVTISGTNFTPDITVSVNGIPVFGIPSPYTYVNSTTITLDPPLPTALGTANRDGGRTASARAPRSSPSSQNPTPALQAGSGNEPVSFTTFSGLELTFGGTPNATHFIGFSVFNLPSVLPGVVSLEIGNNFTNLFQLGGGILIGPAGWTKVTFPSSPALSPVTTFFLDASRSSRCPRCRCPTPTSSRSSSCSSSKPPSLRPRATARRGGLFP